MSDFREAHPELFNLFVRLNEDLLTEDERARLNALLLDDSEVRVAYRQFMTLISGLTWEFDATGQAQLAASIVPSSPASTVAGQRLVIAAPRRFGWQRLAASLLLAGVFYGAFAVVVWQMSQYQTSSMPSDGHQLAEAPHDDQPVVTLVAATDCRWNGKASAIAVGTKLAAGELGLLSGIAELAFTDGAQVILEGPARFTPQSSGRGLLKQGKLVARVPQVAVGFTVLTPTAEIVDLGTEFGVEVGAAGQTDIEVIEGKVDVNYKPASKQGTLRRAVRMTAGNARRFSSDGDGVEVTLIAPWVSKAAIGKNLTSTQQALPAETKYAAAVLADRPLGYWRLSDGGKEIAADASGNSMEGRYYGVVGTNNAGLCTGTSDRSVRFMGPSFEGYVELPEIELPPSFTLELWARSATPTWNTFGWLVSYQKHHGAVIHPEQGLRRFTFYVPIDDGSSRIALGFAPDNISDRFHHYVCTYDADTDCGYIYFDGSLAAERRELLGQDRRRRSVPIRLSTGRQQGFGAERCGEGWVDELAVYPKSLSAEAIRRHFEAAAVTVPSVPASVRSN
jgi:hypothetical protein